MDDMREYGKLECHNCLNKGDCLMEHMVCANSAEYREVPSLTYAFQYECLWDIWVQTNSAEYGEGECVKFPHKTSVYGSNGCVDSLKSIKD